MTYYSKGLITDSGQLLNGPNALANGLLVCNADGSSVISSIDSILGFTPANDAQVVHLAGTETITGDKTYDSRVSFGTSGYQISNGSADNYWKVDYVPSNGLSWKSASGVNNTMKLLSNGRITLAGSDAGISFGQYSYNSPDVALLRDSAGTLKVGSAGDGSLTLGTLNAEIINTDEIADIGGQLVVSSDDIYFQIPGNTRGPRMTVNTSGNTLTWSGSKAGSSAFHKIEAGGGQSSQYPILRVTGLGSSVSNQIQQWVRSSDSTLQAYVTSDGLFQGNTGFTAGDGTSSDSGGLQMATTGGNHAVDVQGNIQYVESYNKTIIRRGSDAVFDSNGAGGVIATAVATLPRGVYVTPASASLQAMVVRAKASQSENIVEFQDSTGAITNQWDSAGSLTTPSGMVIQGAGSSTEIMLQMLKSTGHNIIKFMATGAGSCEIQGDSVFGIETDSTTGRLTLGQLNGRTMILIDSTESVGIGYGVGTSPEGTLEVQDQLGLGTTLVNITAGPTQTTNLLQLRDNADAVLTFFDSLGRLSVPAVAHRSGVTDPTTADLSAGHTTTWKNTTTGEIETG